MSRVGFIALILVVLLGYTVVLGQNTDRLTDPWKGLYEECRGQLTARTKLAAPEPQPSEISVFVLVIDTPDDVVTSIAATEEAAVRELYKYVRRKWNRPVPPPADDDDAVDLFFDSADSDYEIREQPLIR